MLHNTSYILRLKELGMCVLRTEASNSAVVPPGFEVLIEEVRAFRLFRVWGLGSTVSGLGFRVRA